MAQEKKFQDLNLSNAFLFAAALEDEDICKIVLHTILDEEIGDIQVKSERMILYNSDFKCVRLDIFASDLERSYNIEMQNENENNLPKRSRYHQAEMDLSSLKPGQDYNDLRPSIIVFICNFDPFGKGLYRYTYENCCRETGEVLGDEVKKVFLSTKGTNKNVVSEVLINFLNYVNDSTDNYVESISDEVIISLHNRVKELKKNRQLAEKYMTGEELLKREYSKGVEQGSQKILELTNRMISDGRTNEISRLLSDKTFLDEMIEKYKL